MKRRFRLTTLRGLFPLSLSGWVIYLAAMGLASLVCVLLRRVSTSDVHVPLIFILVVLVVSLMTEGYFYGLLAALTSVFTVNVAFTYPYMKMDCNYSVYRAPWGSSEGLSPLIFRLARRKTGLNPFLRQLCRLKNTLSRAGRGLAPTKAGLSPLR